MLQNPPEVEPVAPTTEIWRPVQPIRPGSRVRRPLRQRGDNPHPKFQPVVDQWFAHADVTNGLPEYPCFDVTELPGRCLRAMMLVKLVGEPRRFFFEVVGEEIECQKGFPISRRSLADLPPRNRYAMAREFAHALAYRSPVYTEGPYIGRIEHVQKVKRVLCPYRIGEREFAFAGMVEFERQEEAGPQPASPGLSLATFL